MDVAAAEAHLKNLYFRCMHNWQYDKTNDDLTVAAFVLGRALWPTFQSCMRSLVFCTVWLLLLARCFCSGLQADWLDTVRNCIAWLWLKNRGVVFLFFFQFNRTRYLFFGWAPRCLMCVCCLLQYGVKVFILTSFKDTCYIEILPVAEKSRRGS